MRENLARAKSDKLGLTPAFIPKVDGKPQLGCGGYVFRKQDACRTPVDGLWHLGDATHPVPGAGATSGLGPRKSI